MNSTIALLVLALSAPGAQAAAPIVPLVALTVQTQDPHASTQDGGNEKNARTTKTAKLDLFKMHKEEYVTPSEPTLVDVKPATYLAIAGRGEPGGTDFKAKVGALYSVAYTLNIMQKTAGRDYVVGTLEGLWWTDRKDVEFIDVPKEQWSWKLLIRTPDFIKTKDLEGVIQSLGGKGRPAPVSEIKLETIEEGKCVQVLHAGPYEQERETIAKMRAFAEEKGLSFRGRHHEIYLSDPSRVPPEQMRTILRLPVK